MVKNKQKQITNNGHGKLKTIATLKVTSGYEVLDIVMI
jgi:hypothetical protein